MRFWIFIVLSIRYQCLDAAAHVDSQFDSFACKRNDSEEIAD